MEEEKLFVKEVLTEKPLENEEIDCSKREACIKKSCLGVAKRENTEDLAKLELIKEVASAKLPEKDAEVCENSCQKPSSRGPEDCKDAECQKPSKTLLQKLEHFVHHPKPKPSKDRKSEQKISKTLITNIESVQKKTNYKVISEGDLVGKPEEKFSRRLLVKVENAMKVQQRRSTKQIEIGEQPEEKFSKRLLDKVENAVKVQPRKSKQIEIGEQPEEKFSKRLLSKVENAMKVKPRKSQENDISAKKRLQNLENSIHIPDKNPPDAKHEEKFSKRLIEKIEKTVRSRSIADEETDSRDSCLSENGSGLIPCLMDKIGKFCDKGERKHRKPRESRRSLPKEDPRRSLIKEDEPRKSLVKEDDPRKSLIKEDDPRKNSVKDEEPRKSLDRDEPGKPAETQVRTRKKRKLSQHDLVRNMDGTGPMWRLKTGSLVPRLVDEKSFNAKERKKMYRTSIVGADKNVFGRIYNWGEKNSGLNARGDVQDFYKIRDEYFRRGELFEDPQFPASNSSLFYSQRPDRNYQWLRPHQICNDPKLFVEGFSRFDIQQGELGDCWLLAAAANLTMFRKLFFQVVPDDQAFNEKYAGVFHFRFWQYGRWIDVVIDDRLPTYHGKLIYLHSAEENEFWSALLEKAYAKLHGSYEALKGGSTCEAMEDFTGGVTEMYDLQNAPPDMFQIIKKAFERSSLMGCSIEPDPNVLEAETAQGLVKGHAYSITKVKYLQINTPNTSGKIPLLRLRNPWGNDTEWNGAWSDKSPEWRFIPENEKDEVGLNFDDDGEFWMSYKDFNKYFDRIEICNLSPDSMGDESGGKKWELSYFEGEWVSGVTAGGCRNFLDTFWSNPQYRITLTTVDEDSNDNKCTVIVALMQKNRRQQRKMGLDVLTIGFAIYYLPNPNSVPKPLDRNFFKFNASVGRSPSFINLREVTCRFRLPPGTYCIVPSTFDPNEEGEFLIRVFSENKNYMEEHDQEIGFGRTTKTQLHSAVKAPPAAAEEKDAMLPIFNKLAGDNEELSWSGFQQLMRTTFQGEKFHKSFSNDVCRSLVALADTNYSGKLGYEEFLELWTDIRYWKTVFMKYDVDQSNNLSGFELRDALKSVGYSLNNHTLNILMHRYGNGNGAMEFDEFIMCIVKLKRMIEAFKERDEGGKGEATFNMGEFIDTTLYS